MGQQEMRAAVRTQDVRALFSGNMDRFLPPRQGSYSRSPGRLWLQGMVCAKKLRHFKQSTMASNVLKSFS